MITFSIVTITFNAADVLQPTLDSVRMQDYKHIEHIIVDGASTDDTLAIAEAYKRESDEDDNGHVVNIKSEPDGGLYFAMNKGIERATGDYILFLNAGDRFPDDQTLEAVAIAAEPGDGEEKPAVLYGNTDIIDSNGHFLRHRRLQPPAQLSWRSFREGMLVCHQAFYVRTDIARNNHYNTSYRFSADVDWCIRCMKEAEERALTIRQVPEVTALFLDGGSTTKNHRASLKERFHVMREHYGLFTTVLMHAWFIVRAIIKK